MNHVADAVQRAGTHAGTKVQQAVSHVQEQGYFNPLCTQRHLSVRHYTWDAFRYVGDVTHLVALVLCIAVLVRESGTDGVSFKSHLLFLIVFTVRFSNIFICDQQVMLILYKVLLWSGTLKIVVLMWALGAGKDTRDTLPMSIVLIPTFMLTFVFGVYSWEDNGFMMEFFWTFSMYLEAVAMLPQYIYCYRNSENSCPLVSSYVLAMGFYRMVFGLSWAFHYFEETQYYFDFSSLVSGVLGIIFFCDYLVFKIFHTSTMSRICISMDDTLREAEEAARDMVAGEQLVTPSNSGAPLASRIGKPEVEVELCSEVGRFHRSPD